MAHSNTIHATIADLGPAGVQTVRSTLIELAKAVAKRRFDFNVSLRTLQRAFAATGESVVAHIRHRRLEEARLALTAPSRRPSVSEIAAHWQFADGSHFIRTFKKQYGQTPTAHARSTSPGSLRDRDVCGCRRTRVCAKC